MARRDQGIRRQEAQESVLLDIMLEYGKWNRGVMANGAHYLSQDENPFIDQNIRCGACLFYRQKSRGCDIVAGRIHPDGICKLWIIPQGVIDSE